MYKRLFILFFLIFFCLNVVHAQKYADIAIDVFNDGRVSIGGATNYEGFKELGSTQKFTSKDGEYWLLNISTNEIFDKYVYQLKLPENSQINYVKSEGSFRIRSKNSRIEVIGTGENEEFNVLVQYKIDYQNISWSNNFAFIIYGGVLGLIILVAILLFLFKNNLRNKKEILQKNNLTNSDKVQKDKIDIELFTPRQRDILKILLKDKRITQKELENQLNIPKSSISRNIKTLEIKGIIKKEKVGQTNYLLLIAE